MKYKSGLVVLIVVGVVSFQFFMPDVAHAETVTSPQFTSTTISVTGHSPFHTQHIVAKDPWSGVKTSWVAVSFVQATLKQVGFQTSWNRKGFALVKYPPGHTLAALGDPEAGPATKNQIAVYFVNGTPPSAVIPKLSEEGTVYMPIYYLDEILNHYWRANAKWNGGISTWSFHVHPIN